MAVLEASADEASVPEPDGAQSFASRVNDCARIARASGVGVKMLPDGAVLINQSEYFQGGPCCRPCSAP